MEKKLSVYQGLTCLKNLFALWTFLQAMRSFTIHTISHILFVLGNMLENTLWSLKKLDEKTLATSSYPKVQFSLFWGQQATNHIISQWPFWNHHFVTHKSSTHCNNNSVNKTCNIKPEWGDPGGIPKLRSIWAGWVVW
jgi:hypothetical protein